MTNDSKLRPTSTLVALFFSVFGCEEITASEIENADCKAELLEASEAEVFVRIKSINYATCPSPYSKDYWGAEYAAPKTYVMDIELIHDNVSVYVPLSAFAALSEVSDVKLATAIDEITVTITGGVGTPGGYISEMQFARDPELGFVITKQNTFVRTFPTTAFEKTEYSFPIGN